MTDSFLLAPGRILAEGIEFVALILSLIDPILEKIIYTYFIETSFLDSGFKFRLLGNIIFFISLFLMIYWVINTFFIAKDVAKNWKTLSLNQKIRKVTRIVFVGFLLIVGIIF